MKSIWNGFGMKKKKNWKKRNAFYDHDLYDRGRIVVSFGVPFFPVLFKSGLTPVQYGFDYGLNMISFLL